MQRLIDAIDLDRASAAVAERALDTPTILSDELAPLAGGPLALKCECLQRTGSFKIRGALSKVAALGPRAAAGLVTASAGNHGRASPRRPSCTGSPARSSCPAKPRFSRSRRCSGSAPASRWRGSRSTTPWPWPGSGPRSPLRRWRPALVHPFDDLDVIAGQGTIGLELLQDVPELARVVIPIGGGGLASGIGVALRRAGARVELVGVQASACAPYARLLADGSGPEPAASAGATIADGIAIKHPGASPSRCWGPPGRDGHRRGGRDSERDRAARRARQARRRGRRRRGPGGALSGRLEPVAV